MGIYPFGRRHIKMKMSAPKLRLDKAV